MEAPNYEEERLTPEEEEELMDYLDKAPRYPQASEQTGIIGFFNKVFKTKDTTKSGNLTKEETEAVIILKSTARLCDNWDLNDVAGFISGLAEDRLGTSLSRDAALLNTVVTSKKQLSTESKQFNSKGEKKKWLK